MNVVELLKSTGAFTDEFFQKFLIMWIPVSILFIIALVFVKCYVFKASKSNTSNHYTSSDSIRSSPDKNRTLPDKSRTSTCAVETTSIGNLQKYNVGYCFEPQKTLHKALIAIFSSFSSKPVALFPNCQTYYQFFQTSSSLMQKISVQETNRYLKK